jgi:hypothetical protein
MNTWRIALAATVVTGCTATVDAPGGGMGTPGVTGGSGAAVGAGATGGGPKATGGATGSGATGSGATGSGATGSGATGGSGGGSGGSLGGSAGNVTCTPGVATTSQIPRLTNAEYDRTIRDLLGVQALTASAGSVPSNLLATDQAGGLTDVGWAAYKTVGEDIAAQVMADPTLKAKFISCDPAVGTCLHDTAVSFGRKAFRRPLTTDEVAAFDAVIAQGADITATGAPAEVAEALLYMFLISPSFLQREEITDVSDGTGHYNLSPYETASRLSYLLWGSTPDDTLNQAADAGQLNTSEQVLAQAQRMVMDPRARDMIQAFHRYYMLMGTNTRWDNTNKDATLYPAFNRNLVGAMQQEIETFFDSIVFNKQGTFNDLLTSTTAFVNKGTAALYGIDGSTFKDTDLTETTLDANHPGFLTRLGFLNAYSGYSRTSPILRGAFITKQVLGVAIGAPPPGAEMTMLPAATADLNTNRKQVDQMTAGSDCAGCHHVYLNPVGFALESFNTVGSWQTVEHDTQAPIDTVADVMLDADGMPVHVTGPADLMKAIATAPGAQAQYAGKWVSYAYEREGNPADACTVQQLAAKMTGGGYTVLNLITDLTQTLSFRVRAADQ